MSGSARGTPAVRRSAELPDQPATAGAERDTDRELLLPSGRAGQQEVGHVHAGDQQDEIHADEEQHQHRLHPPRPEDAEINPSFAKLVAFGGSDNTLRAIDAESGRQVLYQGAHNDWVLGTVFSQKGTHLISVSRDGSMAPTAM